MIIMEQSVGREKPILFDGQVQTRVTRIQNLFSLLRLNNTILYIHYTNMVYTGTVVQTEKNSFILSIPKLQLTQERKICLFFEVMGIYYCCSTRITKYTKKNIYIHLPEKLNSLNHRKYPRLHLDDLFCKFTVAVSDLHNDGDVITFHDIIHIIKEDHPQLVVLYNCLLDQLTSFYKQGIIQIQTINDQNKSELTLQERIIVETHSTFFIPNTEKMDSYIHDYNSRSLCNYSSHYQKMVQDIGEKNAILEMEKIKKQDASVGLCSYVLCPVFLYNQVIAYVYFYTNFFNKHIISYPSALYLHELCYYFSLGLTKIKLNQDYFNTHTVRAKVTNLSLNSIVIEIQGNMLFHFLQSYQTLKIILPCFGHELVLHGHIKRYFSQESYHYLCAELTNSCEDDMRKLEEFIFQYKHYSIL